MTPRAVLLDCDGVLVDSEHPTMALMQADFAAAGLALSDAQMIHHFLGGTIRSAGEAARAMGARLPPDWADGFYPRLYARLAEGTPLVPGIEALLDRLDAADIAYAVGSNGRMEKMRVTLGQHPALWARLRGRLHSGQELGMPKPHPGLWLHCAASLGVAPADCVVVDDSPAGCLGAQRAGIRAFGFAAAVEPARLEAVGARVFRRMEDLPALLGL